MWLISNTCVQNFVCYQFLDKDSIADEADKIVQPSQ